MILTPKSMSYVYVYKVTSSCFLVAGIDSGISSSTHLVIADSVEQAMAIVKGFYNRDDIKDLTFSTIEEIGQATYVLPYLTAKGVLREA